MFTTPADARAFAVAIDTQLAATDGEYAALRHEAEEIADAAHAAAGDVRKPMSDRKGSPALWTMYLPDALAVATVAIRQRYAANVEARDDNRARAAALDAVHATHGRWSRFFLVVSSDGHIHRNTSCSSYLTTAYGWQPQLSGASEEEAVAALGPRMCTKCFPSAPAEWSTGVLAPGTCTGARRAPVADTTSRPRGYGQTRYGVCAECGEQQPVNGDGTVRAHKRPYTADEAAAKKLASKAAGRVRAQEAVISSANITLRSRNLDQVRGYLADRVERGIEDAYTAELRVAVTTREVEHRAAEAKRAAAEAKLPALRTEAERLAALAPAF